MIDLARLAVSVRHDIANSFARLGLRRGAELVRITADADEWRAAHEIARSLVTDRERDTERRAVAAACLRMAAGDTEHAALLMAGLREDETTLDAYAADVAAETLAAGVSL